MWGGGQSVKKQVLPFNNVHLTNQRGLNSELNEVTGIIQPQHPHIKIQRMASIISNSSNEQHAAIKKAVAYRTRSTQKNSSK